MYMPGVPIGFLLLLLATVAALHEYDRTSAALCALCILTKHDFWLPALILMAFLWWRRREWQPVAIFAGLTIIGFSLAGLGHLPGIITGLTRNWHRGGPASIGPLANRF